MARLLGVTHCAEEEVDKRGPIPNTDEGTTNEAFCKSGVGRHQKWHSALKIKGVQI